jgi:DNA-binding NarL/FixJ family response regulator
MRREVAGWFVKIQHHGIRKTARLRSSSRVQAGREALELYRAVIATGWQTAFNLRPQAADVPTPIPEAKGRDKLTPDYWKPFLSQRKYTHALKTEPDRELSARIEHQGAAFCFPLETESTAAASRKAAEIYRSLMAEGWDVARRRYSREITVAIFWSVNPFACTYSTLVTVPGENPERMRSSISARRTNPAVVVVESDEGVGRAMLKWVGRQTSLELDVQVAGADHAVRAIAARRPALALVNRDLPNTSSSELLDRVREASPDTAAFAYGIYEDSDHIFMSLSGVGAGYMMRRRPPIELLEPVKRLFRDRSIAAGAAEQCIRKYFQSFFDFTSKRDDPDETARLTGREREILDCLAKGYQDKQIASALGISAWTVHSHLKNLFEKLGVHTRTEAVLKHLHK